MTLSLNKNDDTCSKLFARETTSSATALKKYFFFGFERIPRHTAILRELSTAFTLTMYLPWKLYPLISSEGSLVPTYRSLEQ